MENRIETVTTKDGQIQRFLVVSGFNWSDIKFINAPFHPDFIKSLATLYKVGIIPKEPKNVGKLVFFRVPDNLEISGMPQTINDITYYDKNANLSAWFESGEKKSENVLHEIEKTGYYATASGTADWKRAVPVSDKLCFVSEASKNYEIACNAHFFLMDTLDSLSAYDLLGSPYGMTVQNGRMVLPPLHHRPALSVLDNGDVKIIFPELKDISVKIGDTVYVHGKNCVFYERPDTEKTDSCGGTALMISDGKVIASKEKGCVTVPMGGFVIQTDFPVKIDKVECEFLCSEKYKFALQVGPAMIKDGKMADGFSGCLFCEVGKTALFPPTVYPLSWESGRAGRIVLGADEKNNPVVIWAEAASVFGNEKGKESPGCSLSEMAEFCKKINLRNAINLDGGGSSQLLIKGERLLHLKDRTADNKEAERPVPGVFVVGFYQ